MTTPSRRLQSPQCTFLYPHAFDGRNCAACKNCTSGVGVKLKLQNFRAAHRDLSESLGRFLAAVTGLFTK